MSFNQVILQGNVTRDAEFRGFSNGGGVTKFGVATNRNYKKDDEWKEVVTFVDVEYYKELNLSKGTPVMVVGELENQSWEKDGEKRSKLIVRASKVQKFGKLEKATRNEPEGELVGAGASSDGANTDGDGIPF